MAGARLCQYSTNSVQSVSFFFSVLTLIEHSCGGDEQALAMFLLGVLFSGHLCTRGPVGRRGCCGKCCCHAPSVVGTHEKPEVCIPHWEQLEALASLALRMPLL